MAVGKACPQFCKSFRHRTTMLNSISCRSFLISFPQTISLVFNHLFKNSSSANHEGKDIVPLPRMMLERFLSSCRQVLSTVECVDCGVDLDSCESSSSHIQQGHHVMSFADTSLVREHFFYFFHLSSGFPGLLPSAQTI